jgi:hypothetical protein
MLWVVGGALLVFLVAAGRVLHRREQRQPHRLPYRTGHHHGLGEAPPFPHHRLGRRT